MVPSLRKRNRARIAPSFPLANRVSTTPLIAMRVPTVDVPPGPPTIERAGSKTEMSYHISAARLRNPRGDCHSLSPVFTTSMVSTTVERSVFPGPLVRKKLGVHQANAGLLTSIRTYVMFEALKRRGDGSVGVSQALSIPSASTTAALATKRRRCVRMLLPSFRVWLLLSLSYQNRILKKLFCQPSNTTSMLLPFNGRYSNS